MNEDDMLLLIVGNEEVTIDGDEDLKIPGPFVQHESLNSEESPVVDKILQTVVKHGQYYSLKKEDNEQIVLVKDELPLTQFVKQEEEDSDTDTEDPGNISDEFECKLKLPGKCSQPLATGQCNSIVQKLRQEHPELKKDVKLLITRLTNMMLDLRTPMPPPNFYEIVYEDDGKMKYVCRICKSRSLYISGASQHYQNIHGKRYLKCFACGVDFRREGGLHKHEKHCKKPDAELVRQARRHYFDARRNRHSNASTTNKHERFYCAKCPATFTTMRTLITHEYSHDGLRPFSCDICSASYTTYTGVKRHMEIHAQQSYICDHCGRECGTRGALVTHLNTHKPLRRFGCTQCERRFAQKSALVHHMNKTHLNLPPACPCPICPKRYSRMTHVNSHMKIAHGMSIVSRKMFYRNLPKIANVDTVTEAEVVLGSETKKPTNLRTSSILPSQKPQQIQPEPNKPKEKSEAMTASEIEHRFLKSNSKPNKILRTIVLDDDDEVMNKLSEFIQPKVKVQSNG